MHVQDYLMVSAAEGQTIAGFVENIIFQHFCTDPHSLDAMERWVCVFGFSGHMKHLMA